MKASRRASISFRWALLLGVLTILLAAVGLLGVVSYLNARFIVEDLSHDVLAQTSARVQDRLRGLLDGAARMGASQAQVLSRTVWTHEQLPNLVEHFRDSILINPNLSFISMGLESGAYAHIYRDVSGDLHGRIQVVEEHGRSSRREFDVKDGVLIERDDLRTIDDYDPRKRGWYQGTKAKNHQNWPPVYLFVNPPNPDYPGLTCATPVLDPSGALQGVTTADFDLLALGRYLKELEVLKGGTAFVVEVESDGSKRVVAHPDAHVLIGRKTVDGKLTDVLLPVDEIPDVAVRTLVERLDSDPARFSTFRTMELSAADTDMLAAYQGLTTEHSVRWIVAFLVPRRALMAPVEDANRQALWIGLIGLLLAGGVAWFLSQRISKPLEHLADDTAAIGRFDLTASSRDGSRFTEVNRLWSAVEEMKSGLRSFRRFVPADVVRDVLQAGQDVSRSGARRVLTVCFTDIADFTAISESMPPEQLVELLGGYFEAITEAFVASDGTVDKYIGDAVMAFWGAPRPDPQHALSACRGVLDACARMEVLCEQLREAGQHPIRVRYGIGTGELIVGNIGSSRRLSYTVIGDPVNLAARLESLNKRYGTKILIDETTRVAAGDAIVARPIERVSVKGKKHGVLVYELIALRAVATEAQCAGERAFEAALAAYHARAFDEARGLYEAILKTEPGIGAAFVLAQACVEHRRDPPDEEWEGVRVLTSK